MNTKEKLTKILYDLRIEVDNLKREAKDHEEHNGPSLAQRKFKRAEGIEYAMDKIRPLLK